MAHWLRKKKNALKNYAHFCHHSKNINSIIYWVLFSKEMLPRATYRRNHLTAIQFFLCFFAFLAT